MRIWHWIAGCLFLGMACSCTPSSIDRREVVFTPPTWPQELKASLYKPKPKQAGPRPAVLLIHGGVKIGKDGRWVMSGLANKLAERGYYVCSITYRNLLDWEYPAQVDDTRQALQWMLENAEEEGIDPDRIAVYGYSAGGYLGMMAALQPDERKVPIAAMVAGASPTNLMVYRSGVLLKKYFGTEGEPTIKQVVTASPINYVSEKSPPAFFYHGTSDRLVRPDHTEEMIAALDGFDRPVELSWMHGKGHVGGYFFSQRAIERSIDFLDFYLEKAGKN